jgi:predicted ATPase
MFIKHIKLINWKNFQNIEVTLGARAFIVGANASGKSNFLDSVRFLRDIAKQSGGLQYAVESRGGIKKIRCLSARNRSNVSIEVHLADSFSQKMKWIYHIDFKHTGGGVFKNEVIIIAEKVWSEEKKKWLLNRGTESDKEDTETIKFTHLEQITANKEFREIAAFFTELQYLNIVPLLVRDSDSYILSKDKEDFYGRNFIERVSKMNEKTKNSYFAKINQVLKLAVPQLEELNLKKDEKGIPHVETRYNHWRAKGNIQREDQLSDGTLRLIGLLWSLLDGTETVLLEEPEINLHSEIIKRLPEFIYKMQRKKNNIRQVIITTHSYDLLDNKTIGLDEVIVLVPTPEGTKITSANQLPAVKKIIQAGFTMAEATTPVTKPNGISKFLQLNIFE